MTSQIPNEPQQDTAQTENAEASQAARKLPDNSLLLEQPFDALMRKVRLGWIAGVMSAIVTLLALYRLQPSVGLDLFVPLVDATIMLILSYGVYRRNPWAAVALLAYFTLFKMMEYMAGALTNSLFSLLYGYFFYQAMTALFKIRALPPVISETTGDSGD